MQIPIQATNTYGSTPSDVPVTPSGCTDIVAPPAKDVNSTSAAGVTYQLEDRASLACAAEQCVVTILIDGQPTAYKPGDFVQLGPGTHTLQYIVKDANGVTDTSNTSVTVLPYDASKQYAIVPQLVLFVFLWPPVLNSERVLRKVSLCTCCLCCLCLQRPCLSPTKASPLAWTFEDYRPQHYAFTRAIGASACFC